MATTWEDVQRELAYEKEMEDFETELALVKKDTVKKFISSGFEQSEDITYGIVQELASINSNTNPQSIVFLNAALLETIERETICQPLLVSSLISNPAETAKIENLKGMITIDAMRFSYRHFEEIAGDLTLLQKNFDNLASRFKTHKVFHIESNISKYREKVKSFRNGVVHGKTLATKDDADYVTSFALAWKDQVYNKILATYNLKLDDKWHLGDI